MTVVSAKEFNIHQDKYLDMALDEEIFLQRGNLMYHLTFNSHVDTQSLEQPVLAPDDDLRNAITADELKKKMRVAIHHFFANK
jgi:hypothetical protein